MFVAVVVLVVVEFVAVVVFVVVKFAAVVVLVVAKFVAVMVLVVAKFVAVVVFVVAALSLLLSWCSSSQLHFGACCSTSSHPDLSDITEGRTITHLRADS